MEEIEDIHSLAIDTDISISPLQQRIREEYGRKHRKTSGSEQTTRDGDAVEQSGAEGASGEPDSEIESTDRRQQAAGNADERDTSANRKPSRGVRRKDRETGTNNGGTNQTSEDGIELIASPIELSERRKNRQPALKLPFGGSKEKEKRVYKLFTAKEREERKTQLIGAFQDLFDLLDQAIAATTKGHEEVVIWSDMEDSEIAILIDPLLTSATLSEKGVKRVMAIIESHQKLKVGLILAPRFYATVMKYAKVGFSVK